VRRARGLADARRRDRKDQQLAGGQADGKQVVVIVPIDLILGEQSGIVRNRLTAVEMEYFEPCRSTHRNQLARGGHCHVGKAPDSNSRHIETGAIRAQVSGAIRSVGRKLRRRGRLRGFVSFVRGKDDGHVIP